jgi:3-methyladenine DNA glycosylase AlkD
MELKDIKRLYRLYMNGIVSQSMRLKGAEYRVNFGLTLPLLRRIAEQIPPSKEIAEQLWHDTGVRESMLLAPMVYPIEQCTPVDAQCWVEEVPNVEVADFCCKYLFARLPYASDLVVDWVASSQEIVVYTAFRLAYALLPQMTNEDWIGTMAQIAIVAQCDNRSVVISAARRFLTEALLLPVAGKVVVECLRKTDKVDEVLRQNLLAIYDEEA